ncbi:rRNA (cytosine-C5-)-methyltransferase nop2 [Puccinia graminis f. sp. tritici]|uniref:Nucleolar protein 2 n=1 Tax=Puccinia graminis f. sp. tritici TaxID=56615 RepID=A0A5B0Q9W4_PUCGR|nr:rRNA (cytosine-C5-)-methyltransferase nop2 [Puccinia graminis f. sp. tritici]
MGGFGFKSRHKQSAPEPLRVKGQSKDPKKIDAEVAADEPSSLPKKSRSKVPRSGGKSVASKIKQRTLRQQEEAKQKDLPKPKHSKKGTSEQSDSDSDDGSDKDEDDENGNEDEEHVDEGLEEARKAFFSTKDLVEPHNDMDSADDQNDFQSASGSSHSHAESIEELNESEAGDGIEGSAIPDDEDDEEDNDDEASEGSDMVGEGSNDEEDEDENALDADIMNHNKGVPDLRKLYSRIQESVRVLGNWSVLGKKAKGKSRADVTEQTLNDVCEYFGYNAFLSDLLWQLFDPEEALAFFEANETARPVTIRTNTLRTNRRDLAQSLINRGVNLEPIGKWSKVGLQVFESSVPIGATPEYLAGHYMLQAASSFLPVIALDPQPGEKCLDMSAAPGGKTTFMSAMMKNTGKLFANDSSKARCKSLMANVSRMGCHNVIISNHDARDFPKVMGGFNRVLLDAPCSGTGVISKDASVKNNKSEKDLLLLSHLQKQLILSAIDSVSPHSTNGGYLVYSTCSVTVEENESVVDYALKKRPNVKLVETGIGFGKEGFVRFRGKIFNPSLKMTRRFYPHVHNVDGFFVAKLKVNPKAKTAPIQEEEEDDVEETLSQDDIPDKKQKASKAKDEPVAFDDSEDAEIIASAKISQLKAKGIHVTRPNPEKKRSKKHEDDQPDATEKKQAAKQQSDEPALMEKVQSKKHQRDEQDGKEKKKKKTKVKAS